MMTNSKRTWLLLAPVILLGCSWTSWTKTVWLEPPDQQTSDKVELLDPSINPSKKPFALVEAKGIKTWDSHLDLLGSNINKAKEIGAKKIWCPTESPKLTLLGLGPSLPTKEEIGVVTEFFQAITGLVKAVIAFPVTFRSEAISPKTLLCSVYRD